MHDVFRLPDGSVVRLLRTGEETGGELVEWEYTMPPGAPHPPAHVHPDHEEELEVAAGAIVVLVGQHERTLGVGESVRIERGTAHTFRNDGPLLARVVDRHCPAGAMESYMREVISAIRTGRFRGPQDADVIGAIWERHAGAVRPA
jgi:quercetin dioxygenase-like cupin family protein